MATVAALVSPAQELMPVLETKGILAVTFTSTDIYLEPRFIPIGYARAAQKLGATLCENTTVTGITTRDGAIESVETDQGTIRTPVVEDVSSPARPASVFNVFARRTNSYGSIAAFFRPVQTASAP